VTTSLPPPSDRLIGYLDILGWSEIVRDEQRANDVAMAMLEAQAEKETWEFGRALTRADYSVQFSAFSDCVVLSCDLQSMPAREQLLWRVCRLYLLWLHRGFLSRGAVVVGRGVHVDNVVYGTGLVDAYRLEREVAVYPRIVVREADMDRIALQGRFLRMDDGVPFLNPMLHWLPPTKPAALLDQVKSNLTIEYNRWRARLEELKAKPASAPASSKVIAKHEWLLRYFEKSAELIDLKLTA
jgi:hypothetical protein